MRLLIRLISEEDGADLVEYALLTMAIGLGTAAAFAGWSAAIKGTYSSWNTNTNNLWDPEPKP